MEFELAHSVMGVKVNGKIKWPKGAIVRETHEGVGLSRTWFETAEAEGIEVRYETSAMQLTQGESGRVDGVVARGPDGMQRLSAKAVILACGGFETNPAWRRLYLGDPWDHAKVRGSNFNYGDGLKMAMDIGAMPWGHWGGCHATPINAEAPDYGRRDLTDKTNRLSYWCGVMINVEGKRFVDEGADFNSYTYAKYGGMILKQPQSLIYQIFDSKVLDMLEPRYSTSVPFKSDTLEGLIKQLKVDHKQAIKTVNEYNAAAGHGKFDAIALDGMHTDGIEPPKTNWAHPVERGPFVGWPLTTAVCFVFGGVRTDAQARVVSPSGVPIPGLYGAGEMTGVFYEYYPVGTSVLRGLTFGRIAGAHAAHAPAREVAAV